MDEFQKEAKDIMTNLVKLDVPIKTHISIGQSWDELK
jgi:DNA polymerase I-like protein with 3'-5' exonuclease and polymerase domains